MLYHYFSLDAGTRGIYLTTAGGGTGTRLVSDGGAVWAGLAWLPDGSGFVYTLDHQLYHYHLASSAGTPIANFYGEYISNPSVSPDGRYVVFQWQTGTSNQHDLWIVDRNNPVEMWQLTSDGKSTNPDWSRANPPSYHYLYLPLVMRK
jgi:Tol biopolymer transport system component